VLAVAAIVGVALVWSVTGVLPIQVTGPGILLRGGQVLTVLAPASGQVAELRVQLGDDVQAGQVIGTLHIAGSSAAVSSDLTSAFAGRVVELLAGPGSLVAAGDGIAWLEDEHQPLVAVVYLPVADGARLQPGMAARIVPDGANLGTAQSMPGTVISIARYTASRQSLLRRLGSDLLADQFSAKGAVLEAVIAVEPVAYGANQVPSRNLAGREAALSGKQCSAIVTLAERHPIEWLLP
jgi:multidrug efflux pump subunit AcrA (membrane-fusion protein)